MENVVVLKTFMETVGWTWGIGVGPILVGIIVLVLLGVIISGIIKLNWNKNLLAFPATLAIGTICLFATCTPKQEVRKEVYINGPVDMIEFQKHYEILGQDGVKYIVKDIE